jgi:hypothetical protein
VTVLAACSGSQRQTAAPLIERNWTNLCEDYYVYTRENPDPAEAVKIRAEIERRQLVPSGEWTAIGAGQVGVGTSQCGVFAAWGPPQANNQTVQGNQQKVQLVYPGRTVTTNGTVVTAITN